MLREIHDHYFREAKREGYRSRAAYKLIEIDDRRRLIQKGGAVLDCGVRPGAWLQVAAQRVGPKGVVVGIDLTAVSGGLPENVHVLEGDLRSVDSVALLAPLGSSRTNFDVVLSDMAPKTTGDQTIDHHGSMRLCHAMLDRCPALLRPGGGMVLKAFEGEAYPELLATLRGTFDQVKGFKPKASRAISREMFVIATGYRAVPRETESAPLSKPKPTGW